MSDFTREGSHIVWATSTGTLRLSEDNAQRWLDLAAILKDCEAFRRQYILPHYDGGRFWRDRQSGEIPARFFPPLTAYLGDDGKVRFQ